MKELYFVLFNKTLSKVFSVERKLPQYNASVESNVGFKNPHPFNEWFQDTYGMKVYRRYAIDSASLGEVYFILEAFDELNEEEFLLINEFDVDTQNILNNIRKDYHHSYSCPWIHNGFLMYINWAKEVLNQKGIQAISLIKQIKNAYVSTVFQIQTNQGDYYLKIPSQRFINEMNILKDLINRDTIPLVDVVSTDPTHTAYLMKDMGGCNLEDDFQVSELYETIDHIISFQKQMIDAPKEELLKTYEDSTIPHMIKSLETLLEAYPYYLKGSPYQLSDEEKEKLKKVISHYIDHLKQIKQVVPNSIDHGDLRPGNIRIHTPKKQIIYDFAWSCYTHPFFTIISFFHIIRNNESFKQEKDRLVNHYLEAWVDYGEMADLQDTYYRLEKLARSYHIVTDMDWLKAILKDYSFNQYNLYSADGWLIDRRQGYFCEILKRVINC